MSTRKQVDDEKKQLLSKLLLSVKGCQSRFGSRTELATEDDKWIRQLCSAFEDVFLSGLLKKPTSAQSNSGLWHMTEALVPSFRSSEIPSYWPLVKSQLSKHEAERFLLLHNVRTDLGRSRAWLRAALNEHSLERYIHIFLSLDNLFQFYDESSFLRDDELSSILPQTAAGLGSILFALIVDNSELDKPRAMNVNKETEDPIAKSLPELVEIADEALTQNTALSSNSTESYSAAKARKAKKKKKVPTALISFDDINLSVEAIIANTNTTVVEKTVCPESTSSTVPSEPKESRPSLADESNSSIPLPTVITTAASQPQEIPKSIDQTPFGIYSSSVKSGDNISLYSDASDRLDIENFSLNGILPSERLKPVGADEGGIGSNYGGDPDRIEDLIPVPSYSNDDEESDERGSLNECAGELSISSASKDAEGDSSRGSGEGDERNDDDRVQRLKSILVHELDVVTMLKAELADNRRQFNDQTKILETRIDTLSKENVLLKHQLKKYVGAVQLLKDTSIARRFSYEGDETDDILDRATHSDQATEAAEYERKLIQVAEMHGELMEFNAHLQAILQRKDVLLRTLRTELEDLRGPLGTTLTSVDDDSFSVDIETFQEPGRDIGPGQRRRVPFTRQSTLNERVLINIWIPSAFLTGATNDLHHVYQVFLRIKDTEWNVYRRYSQFHNFHKDLKKHDAVVGNFYFPPKKHLGNKNTKFVDERRRSLQEYLRKIINHTLQANPNLGTHPDKNLLISILPFFGEAQPIRNKRSKSRTRNLFFRQAESIDSASQQSSYPQYTGL